MEHPRRKTKIIATLGRSSSSKEVIKELIHAGIDVARISTRFLVNPREEVLKNLTEAMNETGRQVGVMVGLRESEMRLEPSTRSSALALYRGDIVRIVTTSAASAENVLVCNNKDFPDYVNEGDQLLVDFGKITFTVLSTETYCKINSHRNAMGLVPKPVRRQTSVTDLFTVQEPDSPASVQCNNTLSRPKKPAKSELKVSKDVICRVEQDCKFTAAKPLHLCSALTTPANDHSYLEDISTLQWARANTADFVIYKQIRDREDLEEILSFQGPVAKRYIGIQNRDSVDSMNQLIPLMDGVLVGRGTLALETSVGGFCKAQKQIVRTAHQFRKPAIISTQLLESMITHTTPTSAEVMDVTNAVLDGCDALILTGETAYGRYPALVVQTCSRICEEAERRIDYAKRCEAVLASLLPDVGVEDTVSYMAVRTVNTLDCKLIICITNSGLTAERISWFVPACNILAITNSSKVLRQLRIVRGVIPLLIEDGTTSLFSM